MVNSQGTCLNLIPLIRDNDMINGTVKKLS